METFDPASPEQVESRPPIDVVVVGGGTAGWMTAAALVTLLGPLVNVTLVESADIGIVGVGEATLPHLRAFVERLGIDEADFMKRTKATFKLGIEFHDFGAIGDSYFHPFGTYGRPLSDVAFHHFWLRGLASGRTDSIGDFALAVVAARKNRFRVPLTDGDLLSSSYDYAYQFDATLFAPFLRDLSLSRGAKRLEATVTRAIRDAATGDVSALEFTDGRTLAADLFIDCSGLRSLLLGDTLEESWEDWSQWLPCDRAVACPCEAPSGEIEPYTRAHAMAAGWRWRIPLQHRIGNGYVYSSAHLEDERACEALLEALEGPSLGDPRILRFKAGRRRRSWVRNVVAIGLSSGFLEPLESTSIYLVQMAITQLIELFPVGGVRNADRDEFNRLVDMEYDRIRDFLILHYHATRRDDSGFWHHVREMRVPETLVEKMDLWRRTGRISRYTQGLFLEPSWVAVYLGQGIVPGGYDPRADIPPDPDLWRALDRLSAEVSNLVHQMPGHWATLEQQLRFIGHAR